MRFNDCTNGYKTGCPCDECVWWREKDEELLDVIRAMPLNRIIREMNQRLDDGRKA